MESGLRKRVASDERAEGDTPEQSSARKGGGKPPHSK